MTDTVLTFNEASDQFRELENLVNQLDDRDVPDALNLITAILDRRHRLSTELRPMTLVPRRPTHELAD